MKNMDKYKAQIENVMLNFWHLIKIGLPLFRYALFTCDSINGIARFFYWVLFSIAAPGIAIPVIPY